jgi:hypothetical protein
MDAVQSAARDNRICHARSSHVLAVVRPGAARRFLTPGLGLRRTQLLFPISNELAAIGTFELEDDDELAANDLLIAQIDGSIIHHATRQVYTRDNDFLLRLVLFPTKMTRHGR